DTKKLKSLGTLVSEVDGEASLLLLVRLEGKILLKTAQFINGALHQGTGLSLRCLTIKHQAKTAKMKAVLIRKRE
ncbi:unnamed protein product, partial [Ilex paraguariensis]